MHKNKDITAEKHVKAKILFYDGRANIALVTNRIAQAEACFKEVLKCCLMQVSPTILNYIIIKVNPFTNETQHSNRP